MRRIERNPPATAARAPKFTGWCARFDGLSHLQREVDAQPKQRDALILRLAPSLGRGRSNAGGDVGQFDRCLHLVAILPTGS